METISLPDALNLAPHPVVVFDYARESEVSKQQILLNSNTFSFLQDGHKEVFSGDGSIAIGPEHFLLMNAGHCLMTEKVSAASGGYRSILLFFSDEELERVLQRIELQPVSQPLPSAQAFGYDPFVTRFVESLVDIAQLPAAGQRRLLQLKLEEILLYLAEVHGAGFLHALTRQLDGQHLRFVQTVEANKLTKLSVGELAFLAGMSVSSFKRAFEKEYATSPSKWFQQQRLQHAAFRIQREHLRATEVFEDAGYENLSSFVQAFKQQFGQTPKQYGTQLDV